MDIDMSRQFMTAATIDILHQTGPNVFIKMLAIIILTPLIEIFVLIKAGQTIGVFPTVALVLATGVAGAYLTRTQGFEILRRIQQDLAQAVACNFQVRQINLPKRLDRQARGPELRHCLAALFQPDLIL